MVGDQFTYHFSYYIKDEITSIVNYFRWIDIIAVHTNTLHNISFDLS